MEVEYAIIKNTILEERRELQALGLKDQGFRQLIRSYIECFKGPNALRTLGAALPVCAQQLTGLSFLNTYASLFFKQSGFSNAFLVTTILSRLTPALPQFYTCTDTFRTLAIIALLASISLIILTDKFGRRLVVVVSASVCTFTMLIVGILGFVEKTAALKNFLIFIACVWSFFNVARKFCWVQTRGLYCKLQTNNEFSRQPRMGVCW